MSVIQTLRGKASWLVTGLLVVALLAFLLMDTVQSGSSKMFDVDRTMMAEVNGERIDANQYKSQLSDYENRLKEESKAEAVTDDIRAQAQERLWNETINEKLINAEMRKLGLTVSDQEFSSMIVGQDPAMEIRQAFTDPQTGVFDPQKVIERENQINAGDNEALKEEWKKFKDGLYRNQGIQKYVSMIRKGIYVPTFMRDELAKQQNIQSNISYVAVPYTSIADDKIKISDDEIKEYMTRFKSKYTLNANKASIEYVSFDVIPSKQDSAESLGVLNSMKEKFAAAENPEEFVSDNSDDVFDDEYYNATTLKSANKEALLSAPVGTIVGPYYDDGYYKLSKVMSKKQFPDSIKASHVLISVNQEGSNEASAKAKADSVLEAVKKGASFSAIAQAVSEDQGSKIKGGDLGFFGQGMMVPEFNDYCFDQERKVGDMEVVRTKFGYHVIKLTGQKAFQPAVQLGTIAKAMGAGAATENKAYAASHKFHDDLKSPKDFSAAAKKIKKDKRVAKDITEIQQTIPGIGSARELTRWINDAEVGDLSPVIDLGEKYVIAHLTSKQKKGELVDINSKRAEIETILKKKKKAAQISAKGKGVNSLETLASNFKVEIKKADSVKMAGYGGSSGLGFEPKVFGAIANKKLVNKVSNGIEGQSAVYFVRVDEFVDNTKTAQRVEAMEKMQVEQEYMNSIEQLIPVVLRDKAEIKDNRKYQY